MTAAAPRDVLGEIDAILDWSRQQESRVGYFAALYRHVAVALTEALANGEFTNVAAMEALNETFFGRYLDAVHEFQAATMPTEAWRIAFDATTDNGLLIVQHLLLGANAHINFDLAVAVAETVPAADLPAFQPDYDRMNDVLCALVAGMAADISRAWPLLRLVSSISAGADDAIVQFSLRAAREDAWETAVRLAAMDRAARDAAIAERDREVRDLARLVVHPWFGLGILLRVLRTGEHGSVRAIIDDLLATDLPVPPPVPPPAPVPDPPPGPIPGPGGPTPAPGPAPQPGPIPAPGPAPSRRKVAILGGGQAGLTVALQLTDPANPNHDLYDVTVHQLGWRLGGKGATGRPTSQPWAAARIEEHGLHNWFGFYDNSFVQMRTVFSELGRPSTSPLATFDQAFVGADEAVFVEKIGGQPLLWEIHNLTNDAQPGEGGLFLSPWTYVEMAIELIERMLGGSVAADLGPGHPVLAAAHAALVQAAAEAKVDREGVSLDTLPATVAAARTLVGKVTATTDGPVHPLLAAVEKARRASVTSAGEAIGGPPWIEALDSVGHRAISWVLWLFMRVLWEVIGTDIETAAHTTERRFWIGANLGYACIVGSLADHVITGGFDVINDRDFRAWLASHLFDDGGVALRSPLVEAIYTASFAYPDGNAEVPAGDFWPPAENMEAGTALRGLVRTAFTYKGSFAYRFAAGTADTCYAPIYEVLAARGVTFAFFHRVTGLELNGTSVARILVGEQAQVASPPPAAPAQQVALAAVPAAQGGYVPLMDVAGLPCWPDDPFWDQLVDGAWFEAAGADFENPTAAVRAREVPLVLNAGTDFDEVVVAIPTAALKSLAGELMAASPAWTTAIEKVETVRTQALQLWTTETTGRLGLVLERPPIVTWLYDAWSPLNVWGDYPEIIPWEHWPVTATPKGLGYFCSTLPDAGADPFDPYPDQAAADAVVRANALEMLEQGIAMVLPGVAPGGGVDWNVLFDPRPAPGIGQDRIGAQYHRANVAATERYVLSVVGSSAVRLPSHDPAFPNVWLAGDWTACTLNAGCMEAATMSGMLCANALSGYPARSAIVGADF